MVENNHKAPYAPLASVQAVIDRMRSGKVPDVLDARSLQTIGVPESMAPRTLVAVKFLGLAQEDGSHTDAFERLRRATSSEYAGVLEEILRAAYAPVFRLTDPTTDTDIAIHDAFRQYEPAAQREKMVALFLGLCQLAGIVGAERVRVSGPRTNSGTRPQRKGSTQRMDGHVPAHRDGHRGSSRVEPPPTPGLLFGLTEEDAAVLSDDEFNVVWAALGKVARARARARAVPAVPAGENDEEPDGAD